jgi:hypothetical protein
MKTRNTLSIATGSSSNNQMELDGPLTTSGGVVEFQQEH